MSITDRAIVCDKNIWLDYYLPERPHHEDAVFLVEVAFAKNANLAYAGDTVKDVFYLLGTAYKAKAREEGELTESMARAINEAVWACIDHLTDIAVAIPLDERVVWLARHMRDVTNDFEDNSVLAACDLAKVSYLVTHDSKLRKRATVTTKTAAEMADLIAMGRVS